MKRLVFTITLVALLLQIFSKGMILLSFEVNRDFIAKNFCIQKEVQDNCCKGSCQLKKQLNDDEKKERTLPFQTAKEVLDVLFCNHSETLNFEQPSFTKTVLFAYFLPVSTNSFVVLSPPPQA